MNLGTDHLTLVTRGRNNAFMETWSELKSAALGSDVALATKRMRGSPRQRAVFDSVKLPAKEVGISATDEQVLVMIRRLEVMPLDFQVTGSENEKEAVSRCRTLLAGGKAAESKKLWDKIVGLCREARLVHGTLEISQVWHHLSAAFQLQDRPNYRNSWLKLRASSADYCASIETSFRPGFSLRRDAATVGLAAAIRAMPVCVVFGESGSGKSALVRLTLNEHFPDAEQLWFGPDTLALATRESTRTSVGIDYPLREILDATVWQENILVIDAAERLRPEVLSGVGGLVATLTASKSPSGTFNWRVVVVGQTEAWLSGVLEKVIPPHNYKTFEVEELTPKEVHQTLSAIPNLRWLADANGVAALSNLRTLAWVVQSPKHFLAQGEESLVTPPAIADRLWIFWTANKVSVQRLLMRLADREASFERSFAISEMDGGDAAVADRLPEACPLRTDRTSGRIRFQHDLAADWARYQRLKEMSLDVRQWSILASNPFWHTALRMLGQLLLRQSNQSRCAWDVAYEAAERDNLRAASDILLDALFLDPQAEVFMEARAEVLFADSATRLLRLLNRFDYVGSASAMRVAPSASASSLDIFLEAHYRAPIVSRWIGVARFLIKHRDRVVAIAAPIVAKLCIRWLSGTPVVLANGARVPFRNELADIALGCAREVQTDFAKGNVYRSLSDLPIYQAALIAAREMPQDVSDWALEMAHRRPYRADIAEKVSDYAREKSEQHRHRLSTDPAYRARYDRISREPSLITGDRRLPPWPLGPSRHLESSFRAAILRHGALQELIQVNASVASEVLLASIIEGEPREELGSDRMVGDGLGIQNDDGGYPTAPWKSPYYAFLRINADVALSSLASLINFATERWLETARRQGYGNTDPIKICQADGRVLEFYGSFDAYSWSHKNGSGEGQLYSAVAALEQWFIEQIEAGVDTRRYVSAILDTMRSSSIIGVLINVGKYKPDLFVDVLKPILGLREVYEWDTAQVNNNKYAFDGAAWLRDGGEILFEVAKKWVFAAYRQRSIRELVPQLILANRSLADWMLEVTSDWSLPSFEKEAIEQRCLVAELDYRNYRRVEEQSDDGGSFQFTYPPDVLAAISSFNEAGAFAANIVTFPSRAHVVLRQFNAIQPSDAERIAELLRLLDDADRVDIEAERKQLCQVAAAAVLLLRAAEWLDGRPDVRERANTVINASLNDIADERVARGPRFEVVESHLCFAAYVVFERWIKERSEAGDKQVLSLLTSDIDGVVNVLVKQAHDRRIELGGSWWRLLYIAVLWSGLAVLKPWFDDDNRYESVWIRWRRCLRRLPLLGMTGRVDALRPQDIAKRVGTIQVGGGAGAIRGRAVSSMGSRSSDRGIRWTRGS